VFSLTLAASIGLLLRQAWARVVFIGVLGLGIAWNVLGAVLQFVLMPTLPAPPAGDMGAMFVVMWVVTAVVAFGTAALFGWIIHRLCSSEIAAEFRR
jgi:hypothetical protein